MQTKAKGSQLDNSPPIEVLAAVLGRNRGGAGRMSHHCHAIGCTVEVPPKMHMCLKHWRMVPKAVQDLIWKHYRPGQEIDKKPTVDYIATAFVSISCVALKEGQPLPTLSGVEPQR